MPFHALKFDKSWSWVGQPIGPFFQAVLDCGLQCTISVFGLVDWPNELQMLCKRPCWKAEILSFKGVMCAGNFPFYILLQQRNKTGQKRYELGSSLSSLYTWFLTKAWTYLTSLDPLVGDGLLARIMEGWAGWSLSSSPSELEFDLKLGISSFSSKYGLRSATSKVAETPYSPGQVDLVGIRPHLLQDLKGTIRSRHGFAWKPFLPQVDPH